MPEMGYYLSIKENLKRRSKVLKKRYISLAYFNSSRPNEGKVFAINYELVPSFSVLISRQPRSQPRSLGRYREIHKQHASIPPSRNSPTLVS